MKLFNKIAFMALAVAALSACSDEESFKPGTWDGAADCMGVSFEKQTMTVEKDPVEETTLFINVVREDSVEAADVAYEIVTNTDDVFKAGPLHFEAGEKKAQIEVTYDAAQIGKTYTLQLNITDPKYTSSYNSGTNTKVNVTRVKWNSLGLGTFTDGYVWGGTNSKAEIFQRDDKPNMFRIPQPFHNIMVKATDGNSYPATMFSSFDEDNVAEYFSFRILPAGEEFRGVEIDRDDMVYFDGCYTGYVYNGGVFELYHPSSFTSLDAGLWQNSVVVSWLDYDKKLPARIALAPVALLGSSGYAMADDPFLVIDFPGFKDPATVNIEEDVEFEPVYDGEFTSRMLQGQGSASLYKGVEITNTEDDADKRFLEEYGTPYAIVGAYGEESVIYFCVDAEGNVRAPEMSHIDANGNVIKNKLQFTGMQAMGQDVYCKINEGKSSFSETLVTLNMTFTNADESIEYGTADESLSNITYSLIGTADYTYNVLFGGTDEGMALLQRDDMPNVYMIQPWCDNDALLFSLNEDGTVTVPGQYATTISGYGDFYIMDAASAYEEVDESAYDLEKGLVDLHVAYFLPSSGQGLAPAHEYITMHVGQLPEPAAAKAKKAGKVKKVAKKGYKLTEKSVWSPWSHAKKVSRLGKSVFLQK